MWYAIFMLLYPAAVSTEGVYECCIIGFTSKSLPETSETSIMDTLTTMVPEKMMPLLDAPEVDDSFEEEEMEQA